MHDLIVRGGTVVDGTGGPGRTADVAISRGVVTEVGRVEGAARREIDADGALVTPGFVDIHTHFDGQVTWDPDLTPTGWHGVTTVVMGNCGVGFAPCEPSRRDWLIGLMEGVEDIPGAALSTGIQWEWESLPQYLDAVEHTPKALDVGAQVPHGAVRAYVMGERGARNEPATAEDIAAMADLVRDGIRAGALGFSTSRTLAHRAIDGEPVPGTFAAEDELFGIGRVLGELGTGVFELAAAGALGEDLAAPEKEVAWMRRLAAESGRPVSFALIQNNADPDQWRRLLDLSADAAALGRAGPPAGQRPHGIDPGRIPDVPSLRVHSVLEGGRAATAAVAGAGRPDPSRPGAEGPAGARGSVRQPGHGGSGIHVAGPHVRAGRSAKLRADRGRQRGRHRGGQGRGCG